MRIDKSATYCLVLGLLAAACGVEPSPLGDSETLTADYPAGPLHPDTLLVEELAGFVSADLSEDLTALHLSFVGPASDQGIEPGRIVTGTSEGGYVLRVHAVEFDGNEAFLQTSPAPLEQAVTDVSIHESWTWDARQVIDFSGRSFAVTNSAEETAGQVVIERGLLHMTPTLSLDVDFGFFSMREATATLDIALGYDVEALYEAAEAMDLQEMVDLEVISFPLEGRAGFVSFTGSLKTVVRLGVHHSAQAPMSVVQTMDSNGTVVAGGTFVSDGEQWTNIWAPQFAGQVESSDYEGLGWQGRVFIQIESVVLLDNLNGSSFRFEPSLSGLASGDCSGASWDTAGGITGEAVMELGFFSDGPRTEELPPLNIEADRKEAYRHYDVPPANCSGDPEVPEDDPVDPVDPGTEDFDPLAPSGDCAPQTLLSCGDSFSGDTNKGEPGTTDLLDGYSCSVGNYGASELAYAFVAPYDTEVSIEFLGAVPMDVNHDLFVLDGMDGFCSPAFCLAMGFNDVVFDAVAGHTYYVIVDGDPLSAGSFVATLSCN